MPHQHLLPSRKFVSEPRFAALKVFEPGPLKCWLDNRKPQSQPNPARGAWQVRRVHMFMGALFGKGAGAALKAAAKFTKELVFNAGETELE